MTTRKLWIGAITLLILAGCAATGPKLSEMKSSIPVLPSDKGRIYFYRTNTFLGGAVTSEIRLNNDVVGRSNRGSFFYVDRAPGNYEVATATETEKKVTLTLDAKETKYVRTRVGMGILVGRVIGELVSPDEAQKEMADLAYVESSKK
jgi:Protein of unknown function (DUF2846)